jgi:hypothetical protein
MHMIPKDTTAFFALKHSIDDQVTRLGWTKERAIVYIKNRYGVRSRLSMTNAQLQHLLITLTNMSTPETREKLVKKRDRRRRRMCD